MNGFVKSSTKLSNHAWFYDNIILKFMFFFAVAATSVILNRVKFKVLKSDGKYVCVECTKQNRSQITVRLFCRDINLFDTYLQNRFLMLPAVTCVFLSEYYSVGWVCA